MKSLHVTLHHLSPQQAVPCLHPSDGAMPRDYQMETRGARALSDPLGVEIARVEWFFLRLTRGAFDQFIPAHLR
jgi:hypothetical protein